MDPGYTVDILQSESDLRAVAGEWLALWCEDSRATPFQSPHWNLAWWQHLNPGGTLAVVTLRRRSELVGLAPWWLSGEAEAGRRLLAFLGTGVSDYLDVLRREHDNIRWPPHAVARMLRELDWDECDLNELRRDSPLIEHGASEFPELSEESSVCPVLQLPDTCASVDRAVSRGAARALRYYRRRLTRMHQFEIETADRLNVDYMLSELFRLHREVWSARGQSGVLCGKEIADFHHEAASGLLRDGVLRLYLLRIDGRSAAVFYGFCSHRRTYYYLGGFSAEFARLNPGTIAIGHAIEQAINERSLEFNFLRGSEQYKYWWGAVDRLSFRLRLSRRVLNEN
jgi:CelD/BcsL family acetyltransferase involved in cellulose biosynthesis